MENDYHPRTWYYDSSKAHFAHGHKMVLGEGIVHKCDVIIVCERYYEIYVLELCQLLQLTCTCMLSCLSPHLLELLKNLFGTVHDTTVESLCNLQPYCVLRVKCSVSHDSSIA